MFKLKIHKGAFGCGASITTLVTGVVMSGILPEAMSTPEFASAASGILSALASAVGLCSIFRPIRPTSEQAEE